jgi:hypothetical protein
LSRSKTKSKGHGIYKSGLEVIIAKRLGKRATYETDTISYLLPKRYTPDFTIIGTEVHRVFLEVKGWFRYEDQQKMRAVKFSNPDLDIRMYFPQDNKVQGSKMKNSEWCKKHGFPCAIGRIPRGWLKNGKRQKASKETQEEFASEGATLE